MMNNTPIPNPNPTKEPYDWWPHTLTILRTLLKILRFFASGRFVKRFVQWLVLFGGEVGESALLLATLWVTANIVAHPLILSILQREDIITTINGWSLIAFSLLPELIVVNALVTTLGHVLRAWKDGSWKSASWIWAILYAIPTSIFLVMTITTIASFVSLTNLKLNPTQIQNGALVTRCLSGWFFSLVEMLWLKVGQEGLDTQWDTLKQNAAASKQELEQNKQHLDALNHQVVQERAQWQAEQTRERAQWQAEQTHLNRFHQQQLIERENQTRALAEKLASIPAPAPTTRTPAVGDSVEPAYQVPGLYHKGQDEYEVPGIGTVYTLLHAAGLWGIGRNDAGKEKLKTWINRHPAFLVHSTSGNATYPVKMILATAQAAVQKEFGIRVRLVRKEESAG